MQPSPHIVFAGGGTAGHLFPGLAVADQLVRDLGRVRITFAGTGKPFERKHVAADGFEYVAMPCRPFPSRARDAFRFVRDNVAGYYSSSWFLREQQATLVVGLGGYASTPMVKAAFRRDLPAVLLEQNAVPSLATRWLSTKAALICAAFEEVREALRAGVRLRITGNPLHPTFLSLLESESAAHAALKTKRPKRILVLGGSSGARTLNQAVPPALYRMGERLENCEIVHQTGERDEQATRTLYGKLGLKATVTAFISNMPRILLDTDLAISRAGGTTLAELAAARVPAILLPYPRAADDHQKSNAEVFQAAGACRILDQREVSGRLDHALAGVISDLLAGELVRQQMSQAMERLARLDATQTVARCIAELALAPETAKVA